MMPVTMARFAGPSMWYQAASTGLIGWVVIGCLPFGALLSSSRPNQAAGNSIRLILGSAPARALIGVKHRP